MHTSARSLALALVSSISLAQSAVPLSNWTVPPYRGSSASSGVTTMADVTPGVGFVGVAPCRLVDTRAGGFPAGYGPPALTQGAPRNFDLNSDPQCTGIPAGVDAYSLNITVTNTQGPGFILIYPQGGSQPTVSTVNYVAGQTIANAAIVPAGTNGGVTVIAGVSGTDLIIDINGYFTDQYNPGVSFHAVSADVAPAILGENTSTVANAVAIQGVITSATPGAFATGVRGISNGYGVYGSSTTGFGVVATTGGPGENSAVWARNVNATSGASGVFGWANSNNGTGNVFGGKFITDSTYSGSAGVKGVSGYGAPFGDAVGSYGTSGVVGLDSSGVSGPQGNGVLGISRGSAVAGLLFGANAFDTEAEGYLGYRQGATKYGVLSKGGTLATGIKSFADPHLTDASKIIRYVSLEGPEAGTYFRGKSRFQRGLAVIEVPKDFRMVSDSDGLTIQVTPIGQMATVAVVGMDLDTIVVRGSRDVEFFYLVNGVRATFKGIEPITEEEIFMPGSAGSTMPAYLSEQQKRILIQNGTYGNDGRVNMETARRLGWDKEWEKRERPAPQPADK